MPESTVAGGWVAVAEGLGVGLAVTAGPKLAALIEKAKSIGFRSFSASARARPARSASAYARAKTSLPEVRRRSSQLVAEAGAELPSTRIEAMIIGSRPITAGVPITA